MSAPFNFDRLALVNPKRAGQAAMNLIDRNQSLPPEYQVAAVALNMVILCREFGVHASNALQVAANILNKASAEVSELQAVSGYLTHELRSSG